MSTEASFFSIPSEGFADRTVRVPYNNVSDFGPGLLDEILTRTPPPKGRTEFSSVHIVAPPVGVDDSELEETILLMQRQAAGNARVYRLSEELLEARGSALVEYKAIFSVASDLIMEGADRASIVIFVGGKNTTFDCFSVLIGMLPFRGLTTALVTRRTSYGDVLRAGTPSGVFTVDGRTAARMGMFKLEAVYGNLPEHVFTAPVKKWEPMGIEATLKEASGEAIELPFKIGGLVLPMVTHNQAYTNAVQALARTIERHYENRGPFFPIVSCGETCDALGYGADVQAALTANGYREGYYFVHKSGETYKRSSAYADKTLFERIRRAKKAGAIPIIVAVGGGVNGNSIGLIAAITGADFVEVPTTPMHYNDATTSAKKAFSLVKNDVILSKNILGAFYLPRLVFCVSEMFITLNSANAHATVGEATKTMNMLGVADSAVGATDYHNILGGVEFASDFTRILRHVEGFEKLVTFIQDEDTLSLKAKVEALGKQIRTIRDAKAGKIRSKSFNTRTRGMAKRGGQQHLEQGEGATLVYTAKGQLKSSASIAALWTLGAGSEADLAGLSVPPSASASAFNLAEMAKGGSSPSSANLSRAPSLANLSRGPSLSNLVISETATLVSDKDKADSSTDASSTLASSAAPTSGASQHSSDDTQSSVDQTIDPDEDADSGESSDEEAEIADEEADVLSGLVQERAALMSTFRGKFHALAAEDRAEIKAFMTTINMEVVKAKAMFLAYSDPFEKYRALLFEYAHTLGHGVEAFANMLYTRARRERVPIPAESFRLHGQCVGMAVLWAGAMSESLGVLDGQGLQLHQALVYVFNRHGGFCFAPLRALCETLDVSVEDMCEGVLRVVRRDNKRGYCACSSSTASVDQLVAGRPGKMLKSVDPAAELRYLVEVDEALQVEVLKRAWAGEFDKVADLTAKGEIIFTQRVADAKPDDVAAYASRSGAVGSLVKASISKMYAEDECDPKAVEQLAKLQAASEKKTAGACCGGHSVTA